MADDFYVEKSDSEQSNQANGRKVIDEANYKIHAPVQQGPATIGRGGDPLFRNIFATKEQLNELLEETTTVQDWVQRETCNNVALSCLDNDNLKEIYYEIKDGFGEYGPIMLMGFKNPLGVEIPRLKILDRNGDVIEVLTGPLAMEELNKRALAYRESITEYSAVDISTQEQIGVIEDYSGNPDDYV